MALFTGLTCTATNRCISEVVKIREIVRKSHEIRQRLGKRNTNIYRHKDTRRGGFIGKGLFIN